MFSGGEYKLKLEKAETPVSFTLNEDNIIGGWKIQLGAFSTEANARTQWSRVRGALGEARPVYARAGAIVRFTSPGTLFDASLRATNDDATAGGEDAGEEGRRGVAFGDFSLAGIDRGWRH